jgi:branched-subunit amino acid ABC-type transport system permease component
VIVVGIGSISGAAIGALLIGMAETLDLPIRQLMVLSSLLYYWSLL